MNRPIRAAAFVALLALTASACEEGEDEEIYRAALSGANEIPARTTPASGSAEFVINDDNSIDFTLDVTSLSNIRAGHIHGPASTTQNAGVIIGLFSSPPASSPFTGRLGQGTITTTGHQTIDQDSLLVLIRNGQAYVNVHTSDGVAPANTGPGDFPGGELRGQILRAQ